MFVQKTPLLSGKLKSDPFHHSLSLSLSLPLVFQQSVSFNQPLSSHAFDFSAVFIKIFMAVLALVVLFLVMADHYSDATYCVCRSDLSDSVLQKTLDYACGAGADCTPIQQNGACYQPNTVKSHCNYAVNSYFQRKGQAQGTCVFSGTATTTESDPSPGGGCVFPSSPGSSTGNGTTPPPSILTPGTPTGGTLTPPAGGGGGGFVPVGFGPSTTPMGANPNHASYLLLQQTRSFPALLSVLWFLSLLFLLWV